MRWRQGVEGEWIVGPGQCDDPVRDRIRVCLPGRTQAHVQWFGCGVSEFIGGITDFGGSDSPLNDDKGEVEKAAQRWGSRPGVCHGVRSGAVTYNLAGIDGLALDGPVLAKIFDGTITRWDAPRLLR